MWPFTRRLPAPVAPPVLQEPKLAMAEPLPLATRAPKRGIIAANIMPSGEWASQHPGRGLTADVIRTAFDEAEVGYPQRQCDIFDDILERDAHLRSLVDSRLGSVAGKGWILQAGGEDPADAEAAQKLELALRRLPQIGQTWEHLLSATLYGYAAVEIAWDYVDGVVVPVWLANVPHRRFIFTRETDEPRLTTESEWLEGQPLERGKWIFATMRHRRTARGGLLRAATWFSWLKSLSMRDWRIFSARFGIPFVLAKHDPNADEETIDRARESVLRFGLDGGMVSTSEIDIEVKEPVSGSNSGVHPALLEMCNRENSKLIQGATLTSGEGTSAGSYALGRVHENASFNFTLADSERLTGWFHELSLAFIHYNSLKARPPRLKVRVVREVEPYQRMQIADIAKNQLGLSLDEDQIREENDFKRPHGKALEGPPPQPTPPRPAPGISPA
jgi:phage gp29-like protein